MLVLIYITYLLCLVVFGAKNSESNLHEGFAVSLFKGATSRGFRRFLAQTILKVVPANLIQSEHYPFKI